MSKHRRRGRPRKVEKEAAVTGRKRKASLGTPSGSMKCHAQLKQRNDPPPSEAEERQDNFNQFEFTVCHRSLN